MSTIQNLFEQTQLAEAAYADFGSFANPKDALIDNGFSPEQADEFLAHWKLIDQYDNSAYGGLIGTGFSAALFQNTDTGQYSFAVRGSKGINDFVADTKLITTDGIAVQQLVDMYNYWTSLTSDTGIYQAATLTTQMVASAFLTTLYGGSGADIPATLSGLFGGATSVSSYDVARSVLIANGYIIEGGTVYKLEFGDSNFVLPGSHIAVGLNKLPNGGIVSVDGHSLGGHLAMAFSRLFPGVANDVTAVNGLGFKIGDANVNSLFEQLGGAPGFDSGNVQNVYGINGPEFASMNNGVLQQPGGWDGVYIESGGLGTIGGHAGGQMTDSLAVYNLLAQLDPALADASASNISKITAILKAETNDASHTLEAAVGALGKLFRVANTDFRGDAFADAGRDKLYVAVKAIKDKLPAGLSLVPIDAATIAANASTDIAYRYALTTLNPFAVIGADYSSFNTQGELDIYDAATGAGQLNSDWLQDRAAMLGALLERNIADNASISGDILYRDYERKITLRPGMSISDDYAKKQIIFGGADNNPLGGGDNHDRLYGMGGKDILTGFGGNDTLTGGRGDDTLKGGADNDTYIYLKGDGRDTLTDKQGHNKIYIGDTLLTGTTAMATSVDLANDTATWNVNDGEYIYVRDKKNNTLTITGSALGDAADNSITIQLDPAHNDTKSIHDLFGLNLAYLGLQAGADKSSGDILSNQTASVPVGKTQVVTIRGTGEVQLACSGSGTYQCATGADLLAFDNGPLTLTIPEGHDSITVTLIDTGNSSSADTATLTASYTDADGNVITSNNLAVTFASPNPGAGNSTTADHTYNGDLNPQQFVDADGNIYYKTDGSSNLITDGTAYANFNDTLYGSAGNDIINTGGGTNLVSGMGGNDTINGGAGNDFIMSGVSSRYYPWLEYATVGEDPSALGIQNTGGNGNDLINGKGGQDVIILGNGNNQIYADTQIDLATALDQQDNAGASGQKGDLIAVGDGNNTIIGGNGNDAIFTGTGNNTIVCGPGQVSILGGVEINIGALNWTETSNGLNVFFNGIDGSSAPFDAPAPYHGNTWAGVPVGTGNDTIFGGTGNSHYWLSNGNNWLDAGGGNDVILAGTGHNTIYGGIGNDTINGGGGNNYIDLESGNDYVVLNGGNQTVFGGAGNSTIYSGDNTGDWATSEKGATNYIEGGTGNTTIYGSGGNDTLISDSESPSTDAGQGPAKATLIRAGDGNEYIEGGDGNDTILGGAGTNTIYAGDGNTLIELSGCSSATTTEHSTGETSTVYGGNGSDTIWGGAGTDVIYAGDGGTASAVTKVVAGSGTSTLYGGAGVDQLYGTSGTDTLIAGSGTCTLQGGSGSEVMYSGSGNATLLAGSGSDTLYGGSGTDWLQGNSGTTLFVAGSGSETILGGTGTNTYEFDAGFGNVVLGNTQAADTFRFGAGIGLADLTLSATIDAFGHPALLIQTASGGQLAIDGGLNGAINQFAFADGSVVALSDLLAQNGMQVVQDNGDGTPLVGSSGNTTFLVNHTNVAVNATGSDNTVLTSVSYTAPANVQNLTGSGTANLTLAGNDLDNIITANSGNDTLIAGSGVATLIGGSGNNTFMVNNVNDVVQAQATGSNINTIQTSVDYVAPANVHNLSANGSADLTLSGNDLDNVITANSGNDTLIAGSGVATLIGGSGNDTFVVNNSADVVQAQTTGSNANTILTSASFAASANVHNLSGSGTDDLALTGNNLDNVITANSGNDTLDGGSGNDTLIGGTGQDTFVMQYSMGADTIIDSSSQGGTIQLSGPLYTTDLTATQQGDDLLLQINGTGENMLIQGYYTNPQTAWTIRDGNGTTITPQALLDAAQQSVAMQMENAFISRTKLAQVNALIGGGYVLQADGSYLRTHSSSTPIAQAYFASRTSIIYQNTGTYTLGNPDVAAYLYSQTASSIPTQVNVAAAASFNFSFTTTTTDASIVNADSAITTSNSYITSNAPITWQVSQVMGGRYYIPSGYNTQNQTGLTLLQPGMNVMLGDNTTILNGYLGNSSAPSLAGYPQYLPVTYSYQQSTFEIQTINLGAGDHTVNANQNTVVNSGSGNDLIQGAGFAYGGDGNDTLIGCGGAGWMGPNNGGTLVAGAGNDLLMYGETMIGGSGNDTFVGGVLWGTQVAGSGYDFMNGNGASYTVSLSGQSVDVINNDMLYGGKIVMDTHVLPAGIKPSDLKWRVFQSPASPGSSVMQLSYGEANVFIVYNSANQWSAQGINAFQFADGTVLTRDQLMAQATPYSGASSLTSHNPDGSYSDYTQDALGNTVTVSFDANGNKLSDHWIHADGSFGDDTFNADGTSSGASYNRSYSNYINDGHGTLTTTNYDGTYNIAVNDGHGTTTTTNYDINGNALGYNIAVIGAQGAVTTTDYDTGGNVLGSSIFADDGLGNTTTTDYDTSGTKLDDSWTRADGSSGNDSYGTDGSSSGTSYNPDGSYSSYTNDGLGDTTTTNYDFFGTRLNDTWINADGSHGSDTFNTDGTSSGISHNADGSYSSYINDGLVNTTTDYDASGTKLDDSWTSRDGTSGGTSYNPDGSYSSYTRNWQGTRTTNYDANGNRLDYNFAVNDGQGTTTTWNYDGNGNELGYNIAVNDGQGVVTTTDHDASGNVLGSSVFADDGQGNIATTNYDASGTALNDTWINADGSHGTDTFDASGSNISATIVGTISNDVITGTAAMNLLEGGAGDDTLTGGAGNNTLIGGAGNDTYIINAGDGIDTIIDDFNGTENNTIIFGAGVDPASIRLFQGSLGIDLGNGTVVHIQGVDYNDIANTCSIQSFQFADGTELTAQQLVARGFDSTGSAGADNLSGTNVTDRMNGGAGDDVLNGGAGDDILTGGTGNDTLIGGAGNDTYQFAIGDGADIIQDDVNAAAGGTEINTLVLGTGITAAMITTVIDANGMATLDFGNGDSIRINHRDNLSIQNIQFADGSVIAAGSLLNASPVALADEVTTGEDNIKTTIAIASLLANDVDPDAGDVLSLAGFDAVSAQGNGVIQDASGNLVLDIGNNYQSLAAGQTATDSFTYTITDTAGATSTAAVNITINGANDAPVTAADDATAIQEDLSVTATGNVLANDSDVDQGAVLQVANAGVFAGNYGQLTLQADGSYAYALDNSSLAVQSLAQGQVVTETFAYQATDGLVSTPSSLTITITGTNDAPVVGTALTSQSITQGQAFSYALPPGSFADVDTANGDVLKYSAVLSDGSALPGWLSFNSATGTFNGTPGMGSVANLNIMVTATDTGGLSASSNFSLAINAPVFNGTNGRDTLTGTIYDDPLNGFGGNDTLIGLAGNDLLDGGTGADTMIGGAGNDTYIVDNLFDVVTEKANEGTDTVKSSVCYALGANVENLILTGPCAIVGIGNNLDNVLDGSQSTAVNILAGGTGNDTYILGDGDIVVETICGGTDTVMTSNTYTLGGNVENLTLTGTAAVNGTGNSADNIVLGNTANNTLGGGSGNDMLFGDLGNDTLNGNAGNDLLQGGAGNDKLTDTSGNNLLDGGAGTDTLTGNSGNEMFIGGTGNDIINTGNGSNVIVFNKGDGKDTLNGVAATGNTISLGGNFAFSDLAFEKKGNDLILDVGSADSISLKNWYAGTKDIVTLQIVETAMSDFNHGSGDVLRNSDVETFNFQQMVTAFDQARAAKPSITTWGLTNALLTAHLSSSDTAALGGDLAYVYGSQGSLTGFNVTTAESELSGTQFGKTAQTLNPWPTLNTGTAQIR